MWIIIFLILDYFSYFLLRFYIIFSLNIWIWQHWPRAEEGRHEEEPRKAGTKWDEVSRSVRQDLSRESWLANVFRKFNQHRCKSWGKWGRSIPPIIWQNSPQHISSKWKISHTSQFHPPNIETWSILLNHPPNAQHGFAPLSIKRDFGYFFSNPILQTRKQQLIFC